MANKKSKETSDTLQKYEHFRRSTSENMSDYLEYTRVLEELKELENLIKEEEGGGYDSLNNLETDLKTEENALKEKKELAEELQTLSTTASFEKLELTFYSSNFYALFINPCHYVL